jgi:hypothetical protein
MRQMSGSHLKLYRAILLENPVVTKAELERFNDDAVVEDFPFELVEEYLARQPEEDRL